MKQKNSNFVNNYLFGIIRIKKVFIAYDDETTEIAIIQMVIKRIIKWLNSKKLTNNKYNNKAPKVPKVPGSFGK